MGEPEKRRRSVRKHVSFSAEEWSQIERRMSLSGARSFDAFARTVLLTARVNVKAVAFDAAPLRVELSRIGNNLNQIARQVNTQDGTSLAEMTEARKIMRDVQHIITEASRGGR